MGRVRGSWRAKATLPEKTRISCSLKGKGVCCVQSVVTETFNHDAEDALRNAVTTDKLWT